MIEATSVSRYLPPAKYCGCHEKTLFYDIETTGLSAERSHLYLIGCAYFTEGSWRIRQWFAENSSEEFSILESFLRLAENYDHTVTFNGAAFDLPYLKKKCADYLLSDEALAKPMTDIYRSIKPYGRFLSMKHMNQTNVERLLGLYREDCYNGGELIKVYRRYRKTPSDDLQKILLLHNREDMEGMLFCLSALAYKDAFDGCFSFRNAALKNGLKEASCVFTLALDEPVPKPAGFRCPEGSVHMENETLTITLPVTDNTINCYFPDYEHYMLLPEEHVLIDKKLAKLTGAAAPVPAALETCFQRVAVTDSLLTGGKNALKISTNFLKWILRYVSEKR